MAREKWRGKKIIHQDVGRLEAFVNQTMTETFRRLRTKRTSQISNWHTFAWWYLFHGQWLILFQVPNVRGSSCVKTRGMNAPIVKWVELFKKNVTSGTLVCWSRGKPPCLHALWWSHVNHWYSYGNEGPGGVCEWERKGYNGQERDRGAKTQDSWGLLCFDLLNSDARDERRVVVSERTGMKLLSTFCLWTKGEKNTL